MLEHRNGNFNQTWKSRDALSFLVTLTLVFKVTCHMQRLNGKKSEQPIILDGLGAKSSVRSRISGDFRSALKKNPLSIDCDARARLLGNSRS